MTADAITPPGQAFTFEGTTAPPESADNGADGEGEWPNAARSHIESVPSYTGTLVVAWIWLVAYALIAVSYYLRAG